MKPILPIPGSGPILAPVSEVEIVQTRLKMGAVKEAPLQLALDVKTVHYFADTRQIGEGANIQRLSFTDAIRKFIF